MPTISERVTAFLNPVRKQPSWETRSLAEAVPKPKGLVPRGQRPDFKTLDTAYRTIGIVHATVDWYADATMAEGYETEADESQKAQKQVVDDFAAQVNLDELLHETTKQVVLYGNCYWELVGDDEDIVILDPALIEPVRKKSNPWEIEHYLMKAQNKPAKKLNPDTIIHFKFDVADYELYGIGLIEPNDSLIALGKNVESYLDLLLKRYATAPLHVKVGSEQFPASISELSTFSNSLKSRKYDSEWVTNHLIDINPVNVESGRLRYEYFLTYINDEMYAGLNAPLMPYLRNATEASARAMLAAADRKVKSIQRFLKRIVEFRVFRPLCGNTGYYPKLSFEPVEERGKKELVEELIMLSSSGIITVDEAREELGMKPMEGGAVPVQPEPVKPKIEAMLRADESVQSIVEELGCSPQYVYRVRRKMK